MKLDAIKCMAIFMDFLYRDLKNRVLLFGARSVVCS